MKTNQRPNSPSFKVPVGDLLHKQWSKDHIQFSHMIFADDFELISWSAHITSISDKEVVCSIHPLLCSKKTICNCCGDEMVYSFSTHEDVAHAFFGSLNGFEANDEPAYEIESDMSIDMYPILSNTILINESVQYLCDSCMNRGDSSASDWDEWLIHSHISFITK